MIGADWLQRAVSSLLVAPVALSTATAASPLSDAAGAVAASSDDAGADDKIFHQSFIKYFITTVAIVVGHLYRIFLYGAI